jgi:hypothetical protein
LEISVVRTPNSFIQHFQIQVCVCLCVCVCVCARKQKPFITQNENHDYTRMMTFGLVKGTSAAPLAKSITNADSVQELGGGGSPEEQSQVWSMRLKGTEREINDLSR